MADEVIQHSDLVNPSAVPQMIADIKAYETAVLSAEEGVRLLAKANASAFSKGVPRNMADVKADLIAIEQINAADKAHNTILNEKAKIAKVLTVEEQKQRIAVQELSKQIKEQAKDQLGLISQYQKLSKTLNENRNAYKNLVLAGREHSKVSRGLLQTITEQDAKLKKLDATTGQFQRNVGNYGSVADRVGGQIKNLAAQFTALFAVDRIIAFGKESFHAFMEAEKNANQLKIALKNVGGEGKIAFNTLIEQSEELQKNGIFSDDSIQQAQTQLANYGMASEEIEKLIPMIADLAAANGIDLATATDLAIKGINGQTKGLRKLGIDYKDTGDKAENLAILTEKLTKFQGANASQMETTAGKTERLANAWDDFMEGVGEWLVTGATDFLDFWDTLTGKMSVAEAGIKTLSNSIYGKTSAEVNGFLSGLTGTTAEKQKQIDDMIRVFESVAKAKTQASIAGDLGDKEYVATIKALTQNIIDLKNAREELNAVPVEIGGGDKDPEGDAKKAIEAARKNAAALNSLEDQILAENANRDKERLRRQAKLDTDHANETITGAIDLAQERIAIEQKLADKIAAIDTAMLQLKSKRDIEAINTSDYTAKTKAKLIEFTELKLINDIEEINRKASEEKEDFEKAEFEEMIARTNEENDRLIANAEVNAEKLKAAEEKKYSDLQRIRILLAGSDVKKIAASERQNEQEDFDKSLSLLEGAHDAGIKSDEDYYRELELLKLEHEKRMQEITDKSLQQEKEKKQKRLEDTIKIERDLLEAIDEGLKYRNEQEDLYMAQRLAQLDSDMRMQQSQFEQGLENTLGFEKRERAKFDAERRAEEKRRHEQEENLKLAELFIELQKTYADEGLAGAAKAFAQTMAAKGIAHMISGTALEGTEDTGSANGAGVDGKGGSYWILHPNERVLTKEHNQKLAGMGNDELVDKALAFDNIYLPQLAGSLAPDEIKHVPQAWSNDALILNGFKQLGKDLEKGLRGIETTKLDVNKLNQWVATIVRDGNKKEITYENPRSG